MPIFACPRGDKLIGDQLSIHAQNNQAIIVASRYNRLPVVKLLIESGADIHAQNNKALEYAEKYEHLDIIELLKN